MGSPPAETDSGLDGVKSDQVTFSYGIAWSRDQVEEPIYTNDVQWFHSEQEAQEEFNRRDDKYWPSVLVRSPCAAAEVVERGASPFPTARGEGE